jgi:6-pyruvoyl-tetrahydropterin synthase
MSSKEYVFRAKKKQMTPDVGVIQDVKTSILEQYDHFIALKKSDPKITYLLESQEKLSKEITSTFSLRQKSPDKETTRQLDDKLNHLTDLHKQLEDEYNELLKKELPTLSQNYPTIFEKVKEGTDRETLEHVLTMFESYQSGEKSAHDAVVGGMSFMKKKHSLPDDFFNEKGVDAFINNLPKLT